MIFAPERRNANHERSQTFDIRGYGNSAVVTGRAVQKGAENGKDFSGDYWFTRVYVNQGGRWITVALQTTLIQK
jgi:hypothetical protein